MYFVPNIIPLQRDYYPRDKSQQWLPDAISKLVHVLIRVQFFNIVKRGENFMAFKPSVQQNNTSSNNNEDRPQVDYDAMHTHIIEACGTQDKHRTIPAYISGYYDLGKQPQTPYEALYDADDAQQKENLEKGVASIRHGNLYVNGDNGAKGQWHNDVDIYSNPRKPKKAIAWCITFPQIMVDIDPFFGGESNPRPLNVIMGGEFWALRLDDSGKKEKIIQNITFAQETTNNPSGTWGFGTSTTLHKMGSALDLLNEHNLLTGSKLGDFLGKPLQFQLRIWNKPNKNGGSAWYTEDIKFVSEVPEGLPVPEFDESFIHGINFDEANEAETVQASKVNVLLTQ